MDANESTVTSLADVEHRFISDMLHEPHATRAQNAAIGDVKYVRTEILHRTEPFCVLGIPGVGSAFLEHVVLQLAFPGLVANGTIERMMDEGLILEFGVLKGSSINFFARNMRDRTIHGFDSFEGFGEVPTGVWKKYSTRNKSYFKNELPEVEKNVILHKGYFHYTLPEFIKNHTEDISLLHIDCDIYSSTREIFQNLGAQIVPGTIIIFDEYFNYPGWQFHEYLAFQEFVKKYDIKYTVLAYGANAEGFGFYGKVALRIDSRS